MNLLFLPGEITERVHCFDKIEPLKKHPKNPVMKGERPWEKMGICYPSVIWCEQEQLFKMWYLTGAEGEMVRHRPLQPSIDNAEISGRWFVCYAVSQDGLEWERPNLGRIRIQGSGDNNILFADSGFFLGCVTVICDVDDPDPGRRYKMLVYDHDGASRDGARTAISPNGIDWNFVGEFPVLPSQDTPCLWHDREAGVYVAFLKTRIDGRRARLISTSRDFITWSAPQLSLAPDIGDSPTLHFYAQSAFHHSGHMLGFLNVYEMATQHLAIELIASGTGTDWRRLPGRQIVLAPGDAGAWDGGMVLTGMNPPLKRGDSYWYYYNGHSDLHSDGSNGASAAGIATFRAGRLAGQQFVGDGWFASKPFRCPGGRLTIDAVAKEPLTVEVCGTGYSGALPGYEQNQCKPATGDRSSHAIRWETAEHLDALAGTFVTLRIYGKNAVVYGASFE
ncbi:MAG: hypothetical protein V1800_17900 [Candidatus Latescibacterota bacterium]